MTINDTARIRETAKSRLQQGGSSLSKLFIIHTAVALGAGLLLSLLGVFLDSMMTGGLGAIQSRAALDTVYGVLDTAVTIALPFWQASLIYLSLQIAEGQKTSPDSLLQGFRRIGPILRLLLTRLLVLMGVILALTYIFSFVMQLLPQTDQAAAALIPLLESAEPDPVAILTVFTEQLGLAMLIAIIVYFVVFVYIFFRLRLADYAIISGDENRGMDAIRTSWRLTKGNCLALLKLDLGFWWFYLLDALAQGFLILGTTASLLDMALPVSMDALQWIGYGIGLAIQFGLYAFLRPRMQVSYALAYHLLAHPEDEEHPELEA